MNSLLISYSMVCLSSLICVLMGCKLLHPKQPLYVTLCYLGFIAFFLGKIYELSRILLNLDLYNTFELGFLGIIGALSFWISANFSLKHKIILKTNKKTKTICLMIFLLVSFLYLLIINNTVNTLERVIDFIIVLYAASNVYYSARHLLLMKQDKTGLLENLKMYNALSIAFSVCIVFLTISFSYSMNNLLIILSVLLSITLLLMMISLKEGGKEWK